MNVKSLYLDAVSHVLLFKVWRDASERVQEPVVDSHHVVRELPHFAAWKVFPGVSIEIISLKGGLDSNPVRDTCLTVDIVPDFGHTVGLTVEVHVLLLCDNACVDIEHPDVVGVDFSLLGLSEVLLTGFVL